MYDVICACVCKEGAEEEERGVLGCWKKDVYSVFRSPRVAKSHRKNWKLSDAGKQVYLETKSVMPRPRTYLTSAMRVRKPRSAKVSQS